MSRENPPPIRSATTARLEQPAAGVGERITERRRAGMHVVPDPAEEPAATGRGPGPDVDALGEDESSCPASGEQA